MCLWRTKHRKNLVFILYAEKFMSLELKKEKFREWLGTEKPVFSSMFSIYNCPLSTYLKSIYKDDRIVMVLSVITPQEINFALILLSING